MTPSSQRKEPPVIPDRFSVGAGRYYTEHLPSYYLDGDEPPGKWWGKAAVRLGLSGDVQSEAFHALIDGKHPVTGAGLGRKIAEDGVRGYDATFSAPKSVSVLFGLGDEDIREQVLEAHDAAVNAVLSWIEDHAHTRRTIHGHIMTVDTQGIVAATFRQHTSRKLDPQIHTHAVIANKVIADDGRWLALDARTIMKDQRTLSALYHANLRAELTHRLAVRWKEPKDGIAEIADVPDRVRVEFSQRTDEIRLRLSAKLERFRTDLDREPTSEERWRLEREAAIDSRPAKSHGTTAEGLRAHWRQQAHAIGYDPYRVVWEAVGHQQTLDRIDQDRAAEMVDQAMERLEEQQSSWRPAELLRELAATTPTIVPGDAGRLTEWLDSLAGHAVESRCVDISRPPPTGTPLRRDGRPITEPAVSRTLTTQAILDQEAELLAWADRRLAQPGPRPRVDIRGLDPGQVEVARSVAGYSGIEFVVGPAGAGKTTALAAAATRLRQDRRPMFGVAPTAAAAEVLSVEVGMAADTLDKLLTEHNLNRPPRPQYDMPRGATVILDEAGTASTPTLARLAELADEKQWRVVLVGDPRQFSAVGRGGMFAHLVEQHGAIELEQIHRFRNEWERRASVQLRNGNPNALGDYDLRGRLHGGTSEEMETQIVDAWATAKSRGEVVALMANSNETVRRLNQYVQQTRFLNEEISLQAGMLRQGEDFICVGDEVVTRRNDRTLHTDQGRMVKNRDHWTVQAIHSDKSVTLTGTTGTIRVPADYAASHVELGYAQTSHATQGRTVDTALLLIDGPTDHAGIYTPMTRGRNENHAYVVTTENRAAMDVLNQAISREWIDRPAHTHVEPDDGLVPRVRTRAQELEYIRGHMERSRESRQHEVAPPGRGLSL